MASRDTPIFPASGETLYFVNSLNDGYLRLDLKQISFYEYKAGAKDMKVAWSNARERAVFIEREKLFFEPISSDEAYVAFILAHEIGHIELGHVTREKETVDEKEEMEKDASKFATDILSKTIGPEMAEQLRQRWWNDWQSGRWD